jgi:hypothetical protein
MRRELRLKKLPVPALASISAAETTSPFTRHCRQRSRGCGDQLHRGSGSAISIGPVATARRPEDRDCRLRLQSSKPQLVLQIAIVQPAGVLVEANCRGRWCHCREPEVRHSHRHQRSDQLHIFLNASNPFTPHTLRAGRSPDGQ